MKKKVVLFISVVLLICSFAGCGSDDSFRDTLNSGLDKYYSGKSMTREEYNTVKSYNNWKSKQGSKTYSDWGG